MWLSSLDGSVSATSGNTSSSVRSALPNPAVDIVGCTTSQSDVARMMSAMRRVDGVIRVSLQSSKKGASGSGTSGGGGCNGDQHPSFTMTLFFAPVAVSAPSTAATATAAATTPGATPAGTATAPATGTGTTPATTTSGGGTQ